MVRTSVKGRVTDTLLNTVALAHNTTNTENVYLFRCYKCGTAINQIKGLIWGISAGYIPSPDVVTINQCHQCHENYTFQSFNTFSRKKDEDITLILSSSLKVTTFHCVFCRTPLVQYTEDKAVYLPGFKSLSIPTPFQCFTPTCQSGYYLNDVVISA